METQNIEYKESWRDEYMKWICGFANAQGGKVYIGIDDRGKVVGLENARRLLEEIPNKIVALLGIVAEVNLHTRDGKEFLEIIVVPSSVPISYHGVYHFRSGSTKQELNGVALQQFLLKKLGRTWDDFIQESASIRCINRRAIEYFLQKSVEAMRMPPESLKAPTKKVLENLNLLDEHDRLKNAAILLFGKDPQRFFPAATFKIGRFIKDETDLVFQDLIEGNLIQMADRVLEVLKSKYLISPVHYSGLQRIEPLEIPESSLREAIFNAIVHKDYTGAPIQMKVYNHQIFLWNDGPLPEGFTVENLLGDHSSKPRNILLANAFYKAGFIESWGRGIRKIRDGFTASGLAAPEFEVQCGGLLVRIPRNNTEDEKTRVIDEKTRVIDEKTRVIDEKTRVIDEKTRVIDEKNEKKILVLLSQNPGITVQELANVLSITKKGVEWHLTKLKRLGFIARTGTTRKGTWKILKTE